MEVAPDTNLYRASQNSLPILNHGRSRVHLEEAKATRTLIVHVRTMLESEQTRDELLALQRMPQESFEATCRLNDLKWLPTEAQLSKDFPESLLEEAPFPLPMPKAIDPEQEQPPSEEDPEAFITDGYKACRLIMASLAEDPSQKHPTVALQVEMCDTDSEATLAEWVVKANFPSELAFTLHSQDYSKVWVLYSKGVFIATRASCMDAVERSRCAAGDGHPGSPVDKDS